MSLIHIIIAISITVLVYFLVRSRWILWQIGVYQANALWYCNQTKQNQQTAEEMSVIWPINDIIVELWHWNFEKYVVYQDHLQDMSKFIEKELSKPKLDLTTSMVRKEKKDPDDETDGDPGDDLDNFPTARASEDKKGDK
jgi:hypothetical protein